MLAHAWTGDRVCECVVALDGPAGVQAVSRVAVRQTSGLIDGWAIVSMDGQDGVLVDG